MSRIAIVLTVLYLFVTGCTSNMIHRTVVPDTRQDPASAVAALAETCRQLVSSKPLGAGMQSGVDTCGDHSVEVTDEYTMFYIEFDEQGRLYYDRQFRALFDYLDQRVNCANRDLSIVTFVHGWRHNAKSDDDNVQLARKVLRYTFQGERLGDNPASFRKDLALTGRCRFGAQQARDRDKRREVVGVYVGWRGKSLDGGNLPVLEYWELPSVWDRKNTAQNVAVGSVRELFSRLSVFQGKANFSEDDCEDGARPWQCKRVRLLIVGHSFGGLLVYNAVAGSLMDSLSQGADVEINEETCRERPIYSDPAGSQSSPAQASPSLRPDREVDAGRSRRETDSRRELRETALVRSFADLIVLINPAIEGARYEALHQALQRRDSQFCPNQKPILVAVTADNDAATRRAFPVARWISTFFESTAANLDTLPDGELMGRLRREEEREAMLYAMGHVDRFRTHTLRGVQLEGERDSAFRATSAKYCNETFDNQVDRLLQVCRCGIDGSKASWASYFERFGQEGGNRAHCPAYVEEINAAQMLSGARSPVLQTWTGAKDGFLYQNDRWRHTFCGGPSLRHLAPYEARNLVPDGQPVPEIAITRHAPNGPVWIVRSEDPGIVDNHGGVHHLAFMSFLQQLYHIITIRDFGSPAFAEVEKKARMMIERDCRDIEKVIPVRKGGGPPAG